MTSRFSCALYEVRCSHRLITEIETTSERLLYYIITQLYSELTMLALIMYYVYVRKHIFRDIQY